MIAQINRVFMVQNLALAVILSSAASAQVHPGPVEVDLCKVVASPAQYSGRLLSVEGILSPGEHSLVLYSPSCQPKEGFDVAIQAVFPPVWDSWPHAKRLQRILRSQKNAHVRVSGTFESGTDRYGPDLAQFRFVISGISSVENAFAVRSGTDTLAHESGHVDPPKQQ